MTEVMLLWDKTLLFEKLFLEHDIKCQRIAPENLGTPFLPPCKCLMVPTGFANPAYTKILSGIERSRKKLEKFVENGGILVIFGPMVSEYDYPWLPTKLRYVQKQMSAKAFRKGEHNAQCLVDNPEAEIEFDGYFSDAEGEVLFKDENGNALMVIKELGEGMIIATTIHEFPSGNFLKWVVQSAKKSKI
ncbi:hypothetical protein V7O62_11325 [Methanolobus sp. ZRKC2]|uniref:hypothetical protein n=1 Tax=Methanolobus sp. ZRKC2 TaxID=3125783 RepID=UPI003252E2E5